MTCFLARPSGFRLWPLLLVLGGAWPGNDVPGAAAQAVGGRSRPLTYRESRAVRKNFSVFFGFGVQAAGDLFKLKTDAPNARWTTLTGTTFTSDKFTASLDEDLQFAFGASYRLGRLALRAGYERAEVGLFALARTGGTVVTVPFEKLEFATLGGDLVLELADAHVIPYLLAGAGYTTVSSSRPLLDQGLTGYRLGGGVSLRFIRGAWLQIDVVDNILEVDARPLANADPPVPFTYLETTPQHVFGLRLLMSIEL